MDGTWQIVKWVWVAVCFVWLAVQVVALRRLKGDLKRRSMNVFWVVFVLMMVSDWTRDVGCRSGSDSCDYFACRHVA
jgi:hypothetical protein